MSMRTFLPFAASVATLSLIACKVYDPLYCDEQMQCPSSDRPFCDLAGEYPASEGVARTCIPDPNPEPDADPGDDDAGDGSLCNAGEFLQCTDSQTAIYCNEQGSEYVTVDCGSECDPEKQGCFCEPDTSSCSDNKTVYCGSDGQVDEIEICALGCNNTGERCVDVDPSNGLGGYLDMTDDAPVVVLSNGASIDTDTGTVTDGDGTVVDVPDFQVSAPAGGIPTRVFAVRSLSQGDTTVIGSRALAIVSDGDILIGGHLRVLAGATADGACVGGNIATDGCTIICAVMSGGGGGGFGTAGGNGGDASVGEFNGAGAPGGAARGTTDLVPLLGGCSGGGLNSSAPGGDGGGAVQLVSRTLIRIEDGDGEAHLNAGGKGGNESLGAGGGSGGGILLEAPRVVVSSGTTIVANGGGGGSGGGDDCGSDAEDGSLSGSQARGGGIGCEDPNFGSGGDGAARNGSSEDGESASQPSGIAYAGGGGGGRGRVRVNVPVSADFVGATGVSPTPSIGPLGTR